MELLIIYIIVSVLVTLFFYKIYQTPRVYALLIGLCWPVIIIGIIMYLIGIVD